MSTMWYVERTRNVEASVPLIEQLTATVISTRQAFKFVCLVGFNNIDILYGI